MDRTYRKVTPLRSHGGPSAICAPTLSIVAVEKHAHAPNIAPGERSPEQKEHDMRILEVAIAGIIAVAAQMLVVGAVLI